eukprot:tig00000219_g19496.t1
MAAFVALAPAVAPSRTQPTASASLCTLDRDVRVRPRLFFAGAAAPVSRAMRAAPTRTFEFSVSASGMDLPTVPYAPDSASKDEVRKYTGARWDKGEIDLEFYAFRNALSLVTEAVAKDEHADAVSKMLSEYAAWNRKVEIPAGRMETFELERDASNPARFVFFERYADEEAVDAHQEMSEVQTFMQKLQPLLARPLGLSLYSEMQREEDRAPILSHAMYPYGPIGEGGADDQPMR